MEKIPSEGKCVFCKGMFAKAGITRHLNNHLKVLASKPDPKAIAFHLRVEGHNWFTQHSPWFLNLLVDGNLPLIELDDVLRGIWLECCGHLSSFMDPKREYDIDFDDHENSDFGEPKGAKMKKIFYRGQVLKYDYDFGSTTELKIKVLDSYPIDMKRDILLLSRNEPTGIPCSLCGKNPAAQVCSVDGAMVCMDCTIKHSEACPDFADYAALPATNSPRMGVCAYTGGEIDREREFQPHIREWLEERYESGI